MCRYWMCSLILLARVVETFPGGIDEGAGATAQSVAACSLIDLPEHARAFNASMIFAEGPSGRFELMLV